MVMPNFTAALDTSSTASSGIGSFSTGGGFNASPVPSFLGVPWYWYALAGMAGLMIWKRGGLL